MSNNIYIVTISVVIMILLNYLKNICSFKTITYDKTSDDIIVINTLKFLEQMNEMKSILHVNWVYKTITTFSYSDRITNFMNQTPVSSNYTCECFLSKGDALTKLCEITNSYHSSIMTFQMHTNIIGLNNKCKIGLSKEQAIEYKKLNKIYKHVKKYVTKIQINIESS